MSIDTKRRKKRIHFIWIVLSAVFIMTFTACVIYLNDCYQADMDAIESFKAGDAISKQILEDNTIVCSPDEMEAGIIFYPGGKVEYIAYEPLMEALASEGILF